MVGALLAIFVSMATVLVLSAQALSLVHHVTAGAMGLLIAAVILISLGFMARRRHRIPVAWRLPVDLTPLGILAGLAAGLLLVIALVSGVLGWHTPPNTMDGLTYHLTRAALWRQEQTVGHFPTNDWRQVVFPGNAEVLILATFLATGTAAWAFAVQLGGYLAAVLAVYGISRQLRLSRACAVLAAVLCGTMPEVVLQSSTTQNDLVTAAFVACGVFFAIDAAHRGNVRSVALSLAAWGLALGTKPTAALIPPGLLVGTAFLAWPERRRLHVTRPQVVAVVLGAVLAVTLAAPWYLANVSDYGSISGPPVVASFQSITHPSPRTFGINLARHMVALIDPAGPFFITRQMATPACRVAKGVRLILAYASQAAQRDASLEFPGTVYSSAPACSFSADGDWYGFTGCLVVVVSIVALSRILATRTLSLPGVLALGTVSFLVDAALVLRWQPWEGRLMAPMMVVGAPLLGVALDEVWRHGGRRRLILSAFLVYATTGGLAAVVRNEQKPIGAWSAQPLTLELPDVPSLVPVVDRLERSISSKARLGLFTSMDDPVFPFWGAHLTRIMTLLVLSSPTGPPSSGSLQLDAVLVHQAPASIVPLFAHTGLTGCRRRWSMVTARDHVPWQLFDCRSGRGQRTMRALWGPMPSGLTDGIKQRGSVGGRGPQGRRSPPRPKWPHGDHRPRPEKGPRRWAT